MLFEDVMSSYKIGSIIEYKVVEKRTKSSLLIFDLDGVAGHLHVSEISNSKVLAQKLFNIIRVGEPIMSVIVGFNKEEEYVELSLKPLRNQLQGSLSYVNCKKIVKKENSARLNQEEKFLKENRGQLDRIIGDLAKVDLTFLYELIQNAIDHPNPDFKNVLSIEFEVYNEYLLLKHNGSIFTEDNFNSLTGILLGEENKEEDRIGYKGIGFKSIFTYTEEVYVRSGNFSFSFSKKRSGANTPWEVIPFFEEEIEKIEEIKNFKFFNTPVAFAFKFTNSDLKGDAIKFLNDLVAAPETLLFLDKLSCLEIVIDGQVHKINREVIDCNTHEKVILTLNENPPQEWLVCKEKQEITDEEILKELRDENNRSIPPKFRDFKSPEVKIAYPLEKKENLINLYAYLPLSHTKHELPYVVNGDFIPNLDRTDLIKNLKYNNALAPLAANVLSNIFKIITRELGIEQALTLIPRFGVSRSDFFSELNDSFKSKKDDLTIVLPSNEEVSLQKFIVDESGLFNIVEKQDVQILSNYNDCYVLENVGNDTLQELKEELGVQSFSIKDGSELLLTPEICEKYYSNYKSLAILLFQLSRLPNSQNWIRHVRFLEQENHKGIKVALNNLYYNVPSGFEEVFDQVLDIQSVSNSGNNLLVKYPNIAEVFQDFGLNKFDLSEVLRELLKKSVQLKNIDNKENLNQLWRFLYLNRDEVNEDGSHYVNSRFKEFPINTIDRGVVMLENCFAGDVQENENNYSFLQQNFGKDILSKVDVKGLASVFEVDAKEVIRFLTTIHEEVKLTDKKLFKEAFKKVISLSKQELVAEKENLIGALICVFQFKKVYTNEDLFNNAIFKFPVLTAADDVEIICFTYLDNKYCSIDDNCICHAENLFSAIDGVSFLSNRYLEILNEDEHEEFLKFLIDCNVSPGLKVLKFDDVLKTVAKNSPRARNGYLDLNLISPLYKKYFRQGAFFSDSSFSVVKDIEKLSGKHEKLILFWKLLGSLIDTNLIKLSKNINVWEISRQHPFIWLLCLEELQLYPMVSEAVKTHSEVYSEKLRKLLIDESHQINCFDDRLKDFLIKLEFNNNLSNALIIECLQKKIFSGNESFKSLILDHFSKATFKEDELNVIKNHCLLVSKNGTMQPCKDLIYLDRDINDSQIGLVETSFPDNSLMETFDFHDDFKKQIINLDLCYKSINDVVLKEHKINPSLNQTDFNFPLTVFSSKYTLTDDVIESLCNSKFITCEKIVLGLSGVTDYEAFVDCYYDKESNIYYFTDIRELIDLLCENFQWPIKMSRVLRKLLDPKKAKSKPKQIEYSNEELEQIKNIFGRELEDNELMEENLYAQIKALRFFKDKGYDISIAEAEFKENYKKKYLSPIIDDNGTLLKVMCRSARRGVLFFGAFAWTELKEKEDTYLFVLTGETSSNSVLIEKAEELEDQFNSHYKVLRRENTTFEKLSNLIEAEEENGDLKDLQLLYKVKGSSLDIIFNPKRNEDGSTEGPLTDIGEDI